MLDFVEHLGREEFYFSWCQQSLWRMMQANVATLFDSQNVVSLLFERCRSSGTVEEKLKPTIRTDRLLIKEDR